MSPRLTLPVVSLCLFALVVPACAQDKPAQVLEDATAKTDSVSWYEERDGKFVPGGTFDSLGAIIVKVAPDYYLVRWRGIQGWVKREEVVAGPARDAYFSERIKQNPSDAYAVRFGAQTLYRFGRINEALVAIDECIRLKPKDALAHQVRANILALGKKDFRGAMEALATAEQLEPANSDTPFLRAALWAAQGDYTKAHADFEKAIRLAPNDENIYATRAHCWRNQGDIAKALTDLDTALRLRPDLPGSLMLRANLLLEVPDATGLNAKEAVVSAQRVCELTHWEDVAQIRLLARAREQAGDEQGARRCREKIEELNRPHSANLPPLRAAAPVVACAPAAAAVPEGPLPTLPATPDRKDRLVGTEVSPKTSGVSWYEVRDGKTVCGGNFNNLVGFIVGVSADCFYIHWRGHEGWVKRSDVVVGDDRFNHFLNQAKSNPSDGYLQRVCAQNLLAAGWIESALTYVENAARLTPQDINVYHTRALLLGIKGNPTATHEALEAAERIDPNDALNFALRAGMYWQPQREFAKAEADFEKALSLAPGDETLFLMRSNYWLSRQDDVRALRDMDTCLRLWPGFLAAHIQRAELLMKSSDKTVFNPKEAVASAQKACALTRWEDVSHIRRLAKACELAGYNDDAARWREKADQMEKATAGQLPPLPKP